MARYNDTSSLGWKILSLFLALIMVAGVITGIVFWQKGNIVFNPVKQEQPDETPDENGGMVIPDESAGTGMKLMSMKIAPENYAEYGISPMADTAYQLTATITPDNATNKAVDWTIAFVNPASEWATGKTVTDYVTVTPTADGALTANVECIKDFGEQVRVTVTSRDNTAVKANATVDYTQKLQSVKSTFGSTVLSNGMTKSFDLNASGQAAETWTHDYTTSDYTIADEYTTTVKISFADGVSAVESAVGVVFTWDGETITSGMPSFDKTFFDKVFVTADGAVSANPTQYNKLVSALSAGVTLFEVEVSTAGEYGDKTDVYEVKVTSDGLNIRVEGIELAIRRLYSNRKAESGKTRSLPERERR